LETQPENTPESTPPTEDPVPAVPTHETTPVWARTVPVAPPEDDGALQSATDTASEADPLPALPMQKTSDPEWAHTETRPNEPEAETDPDTDPKQAVPMQKPVPTWAQTVPAPLDETSAPDRGQSGIAEPTQAASINDAAPPPEVIPAATDIWPPDPPTEHTMPAWPPSSTIHDDLAEPETIPEAEAIKSWPDSFDAIAAPPTKPPFASQARELKTQPPAASTPPTAIAETIPPATTTPPAAIKPPAETTPPAATAPPAATVPPVAAPTVPPAPAAAAPSSAPAASPSASTPPARTDQPAPAAPEQAAPQAPASQAPSDASVEWPAAVPIPAWAPQIRVSSTTHTEEGKPAPEQRAASQAQPAPPAPAPKPAPVAQQPVAQQPAAKQPTAPHPTAQQPAAASSKSTWEVVEQKQKASGQANVVPTPEDRSYAEWFSWAKRGGAPASACHAAAQGAFQALSSGKDVATAVQWATAAMTRPPVPVSADRQSYCAWFSLANIDLNLDQHKAHAFATAAVHALDAGADAGRAHAAGLAAAGIR
jgi:hypothetical protein